MLVTINLARDTRKLPNETIEEGNVNGWLIGTNLQLDLVVEVRKDCDNF
jgi:hypothetical protein